MLRGLLGIGLVLLSASAALAFGHHGGNSGGPPTQQLVRIDSSGAVQVYYQVMVCIPETKTRTVTEKIPVTKELTEVVNGEERKRTVTEYKEVQKEIAITVTRNACETKVRQAQLDKLKAFETDGRAIPVKKLKERLTADTLVVVSGNDKMIPDYYAGLFKPGTIILAFEPIAYPAMPVPGVHPAAPPAEGIEVAPQPASASRSRPAIRLVAQSDEEDAVELRVPESAPGPQFPSGQAPVFVFASRDGAEQYKLRQTTEHSYDTTGFKAKRQGTGKQMMPVKMRQTVRHTEISTIDGKDLQFFTGEGSVLPVDRAKEKLSREATVVYAADGEPIDPFWLQNLKPATLVLVGPQLPGGCGGAPVCAPVIRAMPPVGVPKQPAAPPPPPPTGENPQT